MISTKEKPKQMTVNITQQKLLFTELSSEAAATIEGGVATFLFETQGVTSRLRIRERPSLTSRIIGYWYPDQKRRMRTPPIIQNGFRAFGIPNVRGWVSAQYIRFIPGTYQP